MLMKFKEIPPSIHKEIEKPVVSGGISLPNYVLNGAGILNLLQAPPHLSHYPASWGQK